MIAKNAYTRVPVLYCWTIHGGLDFASQSYIDEQCHAYTALCLLLFIQEEILNPFDLVEQFWLYCSLV